MKLLCKSFVCKEVFSVNYSQTPLSIQNAEKYKKENFYAALLGIIFYLHIYCIIFSHKYFLSKSNKILLIYVI